MTEREKLMTTIAYCAAFITLGMTVAAIGPTLPALAANTQSSMDQISYIFTAQAFGYLFGSLLGGRLYDRRPGHPVVVAGLIGMASMIILTPLIPWLWFLAGVLLALGVAQSILDVGGNTLLVWMHRHRVGPYMNGLHFFFGVGAFLSPLIINQMVLISGSITWAYWVLALLIMPLTIWLIRLPSPTALSV